MAILIGLPLSIRIDILVVLPVLFSSARVEDIQINQSITEVLKGNMPTANSSHGCSGIGGEAELGRQDILAMYTLSVETAGRRALKN